MKVESWMIKDIFSIGYDAGIRDALVAMKKHSVRHLPVVENGQFLGLVTLGDLKQAVTQGRDVYVRRMTEAEASSEPALAQVRQALSAPRIILAP